MSEGAEVRVIDNGEKVQRLVASEIDRVGARLLDGPVRITWSSSLRHATVEIRKAKPTIIVLNPETPSRPGGRPPRDPSTVLDKLSTDAPILVRTDSLHADWAREVIGWKNVLIWSNREGLERILPVSLSKTVARRVRIDIRLGAESPICDISIGGVRQLNGLKLATGPTYKYDWTISDLRQLLDNRNREAAWANLAVWGHSLYTDFLEDFGDSLQEATQSGVLEMRFEISSEEAERLFAMPLELLNPRMVWDGFFCRLTQMARRIGHNARERNLERPLLLFIDASSTRGDTQIIGHDSEVRRRSFRDISSAVAAESEHLRGLSEHFDFESVLAAPGERLVDAVRRRLQREETRPMIVHFTGHSISTRGGGTLLIFPTETTGEVQTLPIKTFSTWLGPKVELVVLSSCEGISTHTACTLHAQRGVAVLGFRWEVEADSTAKFLRNFYEALLKDKMKIGDAYQHACMMSDGSQYAWIASSLLNHD